MLRLVSRKHHKRQVIVLLLVITIILGAYVRVAFDASRYDLPHVIVIGVKKAGTTALRSHLSLHPNVKTANFELQFFNKAWYYLRGYGWYSGNFPARESEDDVLVDKSSNYFHTAVHFVPRLVRRLNPDMKLILIVRDPVVRVISDHAQEEAHGMYGETKLEQKLLDRYGEVMPDSAVLAASLYADHLKRWLRYFPLHNFHIVDGDRIIKENPALELVPLETFIGLKPFFTEDHFTLVPQKRFYCRKNLETGEPECLGKGKGRKHPSVDPEVINKLREFLRPHNEEFFRLVNKTFEWV